MNVVGLINSLLWEAILSTYFVPVLLSLTLFLAR